MGEPATSTAQAGKLNSVQMLRGFGALIVLGIHINNWTYAREKLIGPSHIANFAEWHQIGAVGVDIFFVISGFVIALTMDRYAGRPGTFLWQRFLRIAPLSYLMSALWALRLYFWGRPIPLPGVISTLVLAPILPSYSIPTLDVLWTLSFEFMLYLLVALVLIGRRGAATLLILLCLLSPIGIFHRFDYPLLRWLTNPIMLEFALGIAAWFLWRNGWLPKWLVLAGGLAGAAALLAQALLGTIVPANPALVIDLTSSLPRLLLYGVPSFLLLNAALLWQPKESWLSRAATLVGDASFSIYLIHLFVISILIKHLHFAADGIWVTLFLLSIAAGILLYLGVEKPLAKLLSGKRNDKRQAPTTPATQAAP